MAKPKTTKSESPGAKTQHPWLVRVVLAHPRLFRSAAIGFLLYLLLLLLREYGLPAPRGILRLGHRRYLLSRFGLRMVWHSDAAIIRRSNRKGRTRGASWC